MSQTLSMASPITIGADPELFVYNKRTKSYVSAHDLFPGTKYSPFPTAKGAIQVDGVSAEFNVNPAEEVEEFLSNISHTTSLMRKMISDPDLTLVAEPVAYFDSDYFMSLPDDAKALGCTPDYNAWTGKPNPSPSTNEPFRTGSGHIHIGFTEDVDPFGSAHFNDCCELVKQLDAVLYIPSHIWDMDTKRRSLYGKRGAFRPKGYGCEYRVLSNKWVADPAIGEWIFSATQEAHTLLTVGQRVYQNDMFQNMSKAEHLGPTDVFQYMHVLEKYGFPSLPKEYYAQ